MIEFQQKTIDTIKKLRETKSSLNFIQIGAYDGVSFGDMANLCLELEDKGIFVEPNKLIFDTLKENKKSFKNVTFLDSAIIPNKSFYHENFYFDQSGGQSTFVQGLFNNGVPNDGYEKNSVKVLTVSEFFKKHIDFDLDILFLDCEGYDHDLILSFLQFQKPKVIYFESWNTSNLNNLLTSKIFTTRDEIFETLRNEGYELTFEPHEENVLALKK